MDAISPTAQLALNRIIRRNEEGFRIKPYNDRTGLTVSCRTSDPQTDGNLTWLYGCNLEVSGSRDLGRVVLLWQLQQIEKILAPLIWYQDLIDEPVRRSVILDVAFNVGPEGFLKNWPRLIQACATKNWAEAQAQCTVEDPRLRNRYDELGHILLTGVDA